jgi:hypothetical protein
MSNQSNNQGLSGVFNGLGVLLMVLDALFVVVQAVEFDLGAFRMAVLRHRLRARGFRGRPRGDWPLGLVVVGTLLLGGLLYRQR